MRRNTITGIHKLCVKERPILRLYFQNSAFHALILSDFMFYVNLFQFCILCPIFVANFIKMPNYATNILTFCVFFRVGRNRLVHVGRSSLRSVLGKWNGNNKCDNFCAVLLRELRINKYTCFWHSFLQAGSGNTVTPYHSLSAWHNVVFINVAKVAAGCARVVKLLQAWQHVNKRFLLSKQPKYWMTAHHMLCLAWYICCDAVWSFLHGTDG